MTKRAAFTLMELVTAMAIMLVLVSVAIPRFTMHLERTRSVEGVQILEGLLKAQQVHYYENAAYAAALADLDIDVPSPDNFNGPTVSATDPIASIQRTGGAYTLGINADGTITCTPAGTLCDKLGY